MRMLFTPFLFISSPSPPKKKNPKNKTITKQKTKKKQTKQEQEQLTHSHLQLLSKIKTSLSLSLSVPFSLVCEQTLFCLLCVYACHFSLSHTLISRSPLFLRVVCNIIICSFRLLIDHGHLIYFFSFIIQYPPQLLRTS